MTKPIQSGGEAMPAKTTGANPDFPIPLPLAEPEGDCRDALTLLEIISQMLDDGCRYGLTKDQASDLALLILETCEKLKPVKQFLYDDRRAGTLELYQAARRAVIRRSFEGERA